MKKIEGFEQYLISDTGEVYRNNRRLSPSITNSGYKRISLHKNNKSKSFTIHRLVALHYILNPNNLEFVNHKDGDKLNNNVNNLEWCSNSDNLKHAYVLGLKSAKGMKNGRARFSDEVIQNIKNDFENGVSRRTLSRLYQVSYSHIVSIIANKRR